MGEGLPGCSEGWGGMRALITWILPDYPAMLGALTPPPCFSQPGRAWSEICGARCQAASGAWWRSTWRRSLTPV